MNSVAKLAMVTMIALLALMVVHAEPDDAATSYFESDGNTYEVVGDGQVSLTSTKNADLYVPASVYDANSGIEYSVVSVDFRWNDNLRTVVIEYGIESVFINDCENLVSVDLPTSIKRIEDRAFHLCFSLRDVTIPPGVTYVGEEAFCGTAIESISIPDSVEEIGTSCFSSCHNLKTVSIAADITEIPRWAFNCCYELSDIIFPYTVTSIGELAFNECTSLKAFNFDNITNIDNRAFRCSGLTEVRFVETTTNVDYNVFMDCVNLVSVQLPPDGELSGNAYGLFAGCTALRDVELGSLDYVAPFMFYGCTSIDSVMIPDDITTIGPSAFSGCTSLSNIVAPSRLSTVGAHAFEGCSALGSMSFTSRLSTVGEGAFIGCVSMTEIRFDSVPSIGSDAFAMGIQEDEVSCTVYCKVDRCLDPYINAYTHLTYVVDPYTYRVSFSVYGIDSIAAPEEFESVAGELITVPTMEVPEDYALEVTVDGSVSNCGATFVMPEYDVRIIFRYTFTGDPDTFRIEFHYGEGDVVTFWLEEGEFIQSPDRIPVKEDGEHCSYEFLRWDGYYNHIPVDRDYSFYPLFREIPYTYKVEFISEMYSMYTEVEYGGSLPEVTTDIDDFQTREYVYSFERWDLPEDTTVTGDVTIHAIYTKVPRMYTVTFYDNGGILFERSLPYGYVVTDVPEYEEDSEGMEFYGWSGFREGTVITNDFYAYPVLIHQIEGTVDVVCFAKDVYIGSYIQTPGYPVDLSSDIGTQFTSQNKFYRVTGFQGVADSVVPTEDMVLEATYEPMPIDGYGEKHFGNISYSDITEDVLKIGPEGVMDIESYLEDGETVSFTVRSGTIVLDADAVAGMGEAVHTFSIIDRGHGEFAIGAGSSLSNGTMTVMLTDDIFGGAIPSHAVLDRNGVSETVPVYTSDGYVCFDSEPGALTATFVSEETEGGGDSDGGLGAVAIAGVVAAVLVAVVVVFFVRRR